MQLLWTVVTYLLKSIEHGTEQDIDKTYGVCIHYTFLDFTKDLINTLKLEHMINLKVC